MLAPFILLLQLSSASRKFIQTKHMQGGVFGWPDALLAQKNLWASLPLPVKFYKTEIKLLNLIDPFIDDINFSVNDEIEKAFNSLTSKSDEDSDEDSGNDNGNDNSNEDNLQYKAQEMAHIFFKNLHTHINNFLDNGESDEHWYDQCKDLKNIDLLDKMGMLDIIDKLEKVGCDGIDEFIGQFFSLFLIIVPIIVMWVIITLFYIFYCCGCCCCCRAKDRYGPGIVSIVFYALIGGCLVVALIFNILASVYMYNIICYVLDGDAFDDVNYSLDYVKPSINSMTKDFQGNLTSTLKNTTTTISDSVDDILENLIDVINGSINNLTSLQQLFQNISDINKTEVQPSKESRGKFSTCYASPPNDQDPCYGFVNAASEVFSQIDFEGINGIISSFAEINGFISEFSGTLDSVLDLDKYKGDVIDVIEDLTDSVSDFNLTDMVEELNISSIQKKVIDIKDDIKNQDPISKYYPAAKAAPFLFPFILLIFTALELMAFWLKNCCSRCIVCCCCCRCCCTSCLALFGMFCTFLAIPLIFIDIFYDQGDDILGQVLKHVINDDLLLEFPNISIGEQAGGMVSDIVIAPLQLNEPVLIKKFVDAKLNTKLTEWIAINNVIPFGKLANMVNNSINGLKINEGPITDIANETLSGLGDFIDAGDFVDDLPFDELMEAFNNVSQTGIQDNISTYCAPPNAAGFTCPEKFKDMNDKFGSLLGNIRIQTGNAPRVMGETQNLINNIPDTIAKTVSKLITNLLGSIGGPLAEVVNVIEPSLSGTDVDWAISVFNIIRVKACYNLLGAAMAFSISAHLFIVGFAAMTILLCVRRKGMGKVVKERDVSYSYSYSEYSYSNNEPKGKGKKKKNKKGRHNSEDENTSGNGLVDLQDDNGDLDVEKRDIGESDKISDEQSNYNNPYQHDDSTSFLQHSDDESTIQQSESFKPQVSENEDESSIQNNDFSFNDDESTNNKNSVVESESQPAKISETEGDDDESTNNKNDIDIGFHDDESSGNNSDIDDGDQQTYVY